MDKLKSLIESIIKTSTFKVVLFLLVFLALLGIGSILFTQSLRFWAVPFLRALYIAIAIIWSVASIWWVAVHFNFGQYWRGMIMEFWSRQEDFERVIYRDYQELKYHYPLSIAKFESSCWHRDSRPTAPEIMEEALGIPDEEWEAREKAAQAKLNAKRE